MKKNQVNMILVDQAKTRNKVIALSCFLAITLFLTLAFFLLFINKNEPQYVRYKEKSDLDYKVYLKENDYYNQSYLPADQQYIASLIDKINANFNYDLMIEKDNVDYQYNYRIEANVKVYEKSTKKNIYEQTDILLAETLKQSTNSSKVNINEFVDIDYNKYNDSIKNFISLYGLDNIESVLDVNMYVTVISDCEEIEDTNTESVISLSIPLTTQTVSIDMKYDLVDENQEKIMLCDNEINGAFIFLIVCGTFLIIDICLIVKMFDIIKKGRTAETIYTRKLKKILNNFGSNIQKVTSGLILDNYTCFNVDSFTDMLEISDKINQPILMVESQNKNGTHFLIPNGFDKILYKYTIKVSDIENNTGGNNDENFL